MNLLQKKTLTLSNQETLAYLQTGDGAETVIFVHGNMSSGVHFLPLLERLPENFCAYTPDLRGFGDSSYHKPIDTLEDLAKDLKDFVDQLALKAFTLVGWSTGGGVCMAFEALYPGLAKKMVLVETVSYLGYPIYKKDDQGAQITGAVYADRQEMALDPVQVAPAVGAMAAGNVDYMHMLWDMAIYSVNKPDPERNRLYLAETLKQRNLVDIDWSLACFNLSSAHNGYTQGNAWINRIQIPVLAFWGEKDYVVLEHMVTETVEAIGPHARYIKLADSGHSPLIDCPEFLAAEIFSFARN